ncbi:MAG: hypothetical protein ACREJ2_19325 [Planctomycetota bacterium]
MPSALSSPPIRRRLARRGALLGLLLTPLVALAPTAHLPAADAASLAPTAGLLSMPSLRPGKDGPKKWCPARSEAQPSAVLGIDGRTHSRAPAGAADFSPTATATPPAPPAPPPPLPPPPPPAPLPFDPVLTVRGLVFSQPADAGFQWKPLAAGQFHPYAALALQRRSNVFHAPRADHDSVEMATLGARLEFPAPHPDDEDVLDHTTAAPTTNPADNAVANADEAAAAAANEEQSAGGPPALVFDYRARFEAFNRFPELNFIAQHALVAAHLRQRDFGLDVSDRIVTSDDPDCAEIAAAMNRRVRVFTHQGELDLYEPSPAAVAREAYVRPALGLTVANVRYAGADLNFAEYDTVGLNLAAECLRFVPPGCDDPATVRLSLLSTHHPAGLNNDSLTWEGLVKSGLRLNTPQTTPEEPALAALAPADRPLSKVGGWDCQWALGFAFIDVQTFHAASQARQDYLWPVAALQVDGELNPDGGLHLQLRAAQEPEHAINANALARTSLSAQLDQQLSDAWAVQAAAVQEWDNPTRGPTIERFQLRAEVRYFREYGSWYWGPNAPLFLRLETDQVGTAERNTPGVNAYSDLRITLGWTMVL